MTRIISFINETGGVGKTTSAVNVSFFLAKLGYKVLLIDFDPQASATSIIGIENNPNNPLKSSYDIFYNRFNPKKDIKKSYGVDVIPADDRLAGIEMGEIASKTAREKILYKFLKNNNLEYDFILLDCKGSIGFLSLNALVASTDYIGIVQSEYLALEGIPKLLKTVNTLQSELEISPNLMGILVTMFNKNLIEHKSSLSNLKNSKELSPFLFETIIRTNTEVVRAKRHGKPVGVYSPNCRASQDYHKFAKEIILRMNKYKELEL